MNLTVTTKQPTSTRLRPQKSWRGVFLVTLYLAGILAVAFLFLDGVSYYTTAYLDRPHHPDYRDLRPAGQLGLVYGIIGSVMMILMLVYTLRKRTGIFGRRVPLRPFLDFHIYMGVFGPLLILLHTSFKVQGLVAVAFWSMVAVALSGYFGRYLYQQIPRNLEDRELSLQEIDQLIAQLGEDLRAAGNIDERALEKISARVDRAYAPGGKRASIAGLILSDLARPWTDARLRRELMRTTKLRGSLFHRIYTAARTRALYRRRLALLDRMQRLFHHWHVIHKPFAIIMYIIMGVHIGVAIWTGYGWF